MILQNEICHIVINIDETYTVDSADNRHYDVTLNPGDYGRSDFSKHWQFILIYIRRNIK